MVMLTKAILVTLHLIYLPACLLLCAVILQKMVNRQQWTENGHLKEPDRTNKGKTITEPDRENVFKKSEIESDLQSDFLYLLALPLYCNNNGFTFPIKSI